MLILAGTSAVLPTKRDALLAQIQQRCPSVVSVDALWIHLVSAPDSESLLSDTGTEARKILDRLLDYGNDTKLDGTVAQFDKGENLAYVYPRPGSISPWSSKATDIALICRLGEYVERIERGVVYVFQTSDGKHISSTQLQSFSSLIHDRMTQEIGLTPPTEASLFSHHEPRPLRTVEVKAFDKQTAVEKLSIDNKELGLALAADEISYLIDAYLSSIDHDPTDAELFMFAQVNSEHCRHKIFNASWAIDDASQDMSLFQMIRNTERITSAGTISAYSDNAAVLEGHPAPRFQVFQDGNSIPTSKNVDAPLRNVYGTHDEEMPILIKVETHNHPTAVSPYPGAATGSGGEIRDEGAVGRGSRPKAGLAGFTVSNLLIPGHVQPWETDFGKPAHIASALDIMIDGPLGASAFNNEFGRPALAGYFRTYAESVPASLASGENEQRREVRGYHKPIMIAGGYGNVRPMFAKKTPISHGAHVVVLGGPGLLIGLGGGAASSQVSGASSADLDFASVQRDNAEMQRRCQQVMDACVGLGEEGNPIESIHDVGAGGLSNALPELVHDSGLGATFELRDVLVADTSMSPMEIWCNESQERYVLAVSEERAALFEEIARRERCPFSVVGKATEEEELVVTDKLLGKDVIRLRMSTLFGKPPKMSRSDKRLERARIPFDISLSRYLSSPSGSTADVLKEAVNRVLRLPTVGSKSFLITIGDRSITGLVTREQMVGPWQVPVADVAVTASSYGFRVTTGEAMAMGERTPAALLSSTASARMAVGEALTNLAAAAGMAELSRVKLSANWMCAAGQPGEGAALYEAVRAVGMELCPALGVGIPVGKDSMSMSMKWKDAETHEQRDVSAPLSLIVTAFAPVEDVSATWTPQLRTDVDEPTVLVLIDLAKGKTRLGASALTQVFKELGDYSPDVEDPVLLKSFLNGCRTIPREAPDLILAYHDRSDGGLFTTIVEMCFAGRTGASVELDASQDPVDALFNEELGAVVQIRESDLDSLRERFNAAGVSSDNVHVVGRVSNDEAIKVIYGSDALLDTSRASLQEAWSSTSYAMQSLRDNPLCAKSEHLLISEDNHKGLFYAPTFTPQPSRNLFRRPKVAILREQGVNGQMEMAWAFTEADFDAVDVHMSDILSERVDLADFKGFVGCGGFSYGDVLGAGKGWANSVLLNEQARKQFTEFFKDEQKFALGVCNGCQFLSHLREILPSGCEMWPDFKPNESGRFEARTVMAEVVDGEATRKSPFLREMVGSKVPVAVAHGEGRTSRTVPAELVGVRYVDSEGMPTEVYPLNPNGSEGGVTGVLSNDGRVLAMMPHPERVVRLECNSWVGHSMRSGNGIGPWFKLFQSARRWCGP